MRLLVLDMVRNVRWIGVSIGEKYTLIIWGCLQEIIQNNFKH